MFTRVLPILLICSIVIAATVPLSFSGNVGAVQAPNGDTRIYYQEADNSIHQLTVPGPFDSSSLVQGSGLLIPASAIKPNSLIAATTLFEGDFNEIHVYFVSPNNTLSEYIWTLSSRAWAGGVNCTQCIDMNGFAVQPTGTVFYALGNDDARAPALLRVGFISAAAPSTMSEAVYHTGSGWTLAQLSH